MTGTECGLFTHKSVPVIFESPCIISLWDSTFNLWIRHNGSISAIHDSKESFSNKITSKLLIPWTTYGSGTPITWYSHSPGVTPMDTLKGGYDEVPIVVINVKQIQNKIKDTNKTVLLDTEHENRLGNEG
jgi:hypothetical protein